MTAVVEIPFQVHGEGDPVIWGAGWNPVMIDVVRGRFPRTTAGKQIVTFTYRGPTDDGQPLEQSSEAYARDVLSVMDRAGIERAHVVGTGGMGALTMMQLAAMEPDRVHSLVLHQGYLRADQRLRWAGELFTTLRRDSGYAACQRLVLLVSHSPSFLDEHGEGLLSKEWTALADETEAARHYGYIKACSEHDASDRIHQVTAPCLVMTGDDADPLTGGWLAEELGEHLPQAEVIVMPGVPHAYWEMPSAIAALDEAISGFQAKHAFDAGAVG